MFWREQIEVEALRKNICALRNRQYFHFVLFETTVTPPSAEMISARSGGPRIRLPVPTGRGNRAGEK